MSRFSPNHRRVVVTGLGSINPLGCDVSSSWQQLIEGKSGISVIRSFDASGLSSQIAGEINNFNADDFFSSKDARRMDRFMQLGVASGLEAFKDSGLEVSNDNAEKIGIYIGSGIGGVGMIEKITLDMQQRGAKRVSPFYIPMTIINLIGGNLSIMLGLKGPNLSMVTACSTGTHAIGQAARLIEYGDADVMVAGGAESAITPTSVAGFASAKALSKNNNNPECASRPWDIDRDGFVISEGAGSMVLEEYEHAKRRGARIYAELLGFGMSSDAYHMTSPTPGGEGASRCMESALQNSKINADDVEYINAHGTSTNLGDLAEVLGIKKTFGEKAKKIPVSSNKSMMGHMLGAAGGVEAVMTVLTLYHGIIPPTINLVKQDPLCDLDFVPKTAREKKIDVAISNSFAFGGTNGSLVFGSCRNL